MKPIYRRKSWRLGRSFGTWFVPYCGKCKRQLGLLADKRFKECPMCGEPIDWSDEE